MTPIHLILIGDELLMGKRQDRHLQRIASSLADRGAELASCETIRDLPGSVTEAVSRRLSENTLILTTGGLGPTLDDLTREGISAATGVGLRFDELLWGNLKQRYERRGRKISESSRSQALVPERGTFFPNHHGTAPGLVFEPVEPAGSLVVALPGPPRELNPMWDEQALPYLAERFQWPPPPNRILIRFVMAPEAGIDEKMRPILAQNQEIGLSSLIRIGRVDVTLSLPVDFPNGVGVLKSVASATEEAFPNQVFDHTDFLAGETKGMLEFEQVILNLLRDRKEMLACAESCTGGTISKWLTDFPGSSDVFLGGTVSYHNRLKERFLQVDPETLESEGAASEATAGQMVRGLLEATGADWGIAVTGIAGPGGGTEEKPVGLVYIGVGDRDEVEVRRFEFPGDREMVREMAANAALWMLWKKLIDRTTQRIES